MLNKKNFYINGKWVKPDSEEEIKVINPAYEDVCTQSTQGNKKDVDTAVMRHMMINIRPVVKEANEILKIPEDKRGLFLTNAFLLK